MQKRDLIIGATVLIVIAVIVFFIQRRKSEIVTPVPTATPTLEETQNSIENKFKVNIPEDADKAELKDAHGTGFSGIATREFKNGVYSITVLADLPDPDTGMFYQAWLSDGSGTSRLLGTLRMAKGGYLLDYTTSQDLRPLSSVAISLETKNDAKVEEVVLQGSY